jgi:hypothetical protein
MTRVFRRAVASACLLGSLLGSTACTDYETGFFILGTAALEAPQCGVTAEANATRLLDGALDVGLKLEYEATLLVGNQLTPRGDKENLRTETQVTTIFGAEIQLLNDTGELDTEFTVATSGVIIPSAAEEPGFGAVNVVLIPGTSGAALAADITDPRERRTRVAKVKVFGETIGGIEVESAEYTFVITVCEGCLVDFPVEALASDGSCTMAGDQLPVEPCRPGQDNDLDCRLCSGAAVCSFL